VGDPHVRAQEIGFEVGGGGGGGGENAPGLPGKKKSLSCITEFPAGLAWNQVPSFYCFLYVSFLYLHKNQLSLLEND